MDDVPSPAGADFEQNLSPDNVDYASGDAFPHEAPLAQLALSLPDNSAKVLCSFFITFLYQWIIVLSLP